MSDRQWAGHDARRRGLRRQPQLLPPRGGRPRASTATATWCRPTRAAAPSTSSARSLIKPGDVRARQHVLHDDAPAPGAGRRHVRRRDHRRGARPGRACIPFKGNVDLDKLRGAHRRGRRRADPLRLRGRHREHGRRPADLAWPTCASVRALCDAARHPHHPRRHARWSRTPTSSRSASRATPSESIAEILREFCSYTDGCTMSAKKDASSTSAAGWP